MVAVTSARCYLSLLEEKDEEILQHAVEKLNEVVDDFWAEISESVDLIESLAENEAFGCRELASLVVSKVYYHLGEFERAMNYAFGAGVYFDIFKRNEFVETLVAKCVDSYITNQVNQKPSDSRLENIIESMFHRCIQNGEYKQAIGIALEARRFDKIREAVLCSKDSQTLLNYCFEISMTLVNSHDLRHQVFKLLADLHRELQSPDYVAICRIFVFLGDSVEVAQTLSRLISGSEDEALLAYQIAFDLISNGTQQFIADVRKNLPKFEGDPEEDDEIDGPTAMKDDVAEEEAKRKKEDSVDHRSKKLHNILSGETTVGLYLSFLSRNNKADLGILKSTKAVLESRNSVTHNATILANSIMNAGTTRDTFLHENLEWLSRAINWAKFSVTAGFGVIHKGHLAEGRTLLDPYLPKLNSSAYFAEGGALYALGIIHANHGEKITQYLMDQLTNAIENNVPGKEVVLHGACLGLGLAGMASGDLTIFNKLMEVLQIDNAVAGEAAGIAIGLVMLGTANETALQEMIQFAHKTKHEKIIRGLSTGIALLVYGREEEAEELIKELSADQDAILRYGGMLTVALAYCGTASSTAIRHLLHFAVSDVSDDVRRSAVMALGFVLSRDPDQVPKIVQLLSESYNPHVRYGACIAVGIACAGTAMKEAINLLLPMTSDPVDFVRQGALIALAMVLVQATASQEPKVEKVRKIFEEKVADRHEQTMAKFGAILAQGIIDAGGRNVTISLHSQSGHKNMTGIVGVALFIQYWYWFPLIHCLSLAFTPTVVIGLNSNLQLPVFSFKSNAKPSQFAYPKEVKVAENKGPVKVTTAVLSTARKTATRRNQEKKGGAESKEPSSNAPMMDDDDATVAVAKEKEEHKERKEREVIVKEEEPTFEIKQNPARITLAQTKYISMDVDPRYKPISQRNLFGIVVLKDSKPEEPVMIVGQEDSESAGASSSSSSSSSSVSAVEAEEEEEEEPKPPKPFRLQV